MFWDGARCQCHHCPPLPAASSAASSRITGGSKVQASLLSRIPLRDLPVNLPSHGLPFIPFSRRLGTTLHNFTPSRTWGPRTKSLSVSILGFVQSFHPLDGQLLPYPRLVHPHLSRSELVLAVQ